jgi:D-alanine-D-alanine ligase
VAEANGRLPLVLNYCDGDEIFGEPGISVIRELEDKGVIFTGADAAFYHISTSKIRMKEAFERAGVPTAPFAVIIDPERDTAGLCSRLGMPLMVKPAVSAGSFGLSLHSVVHDDAELKAQVEYLLQGQYGREFAAGGIFAERFVNGPEFTVFVLGSPDFPETARVYPPVERAFNLGLPDEERFFSYDRYWEIYKEETPLPEGQRMYEYRLAEPDLQKRLADIAWQAYCAVGGAGYGRVDFRMDKNTGELFVLEVNANCGISSPEDDSSVGNILRLSGIPFIQLMGDILTGALVRNLVPSNGK